LQKCMNFHRQASEKMTERWGASFRKAALSEKMTKFPNPFTRLWKQSEGFKFPWSWNFPLQKPEKQAWSWNCKIRLKLTKEDRES
jgi:hypothetical protein